MCILAIIILFLGCIIFACGIAYIWENMNALKKQQEGSISTRHDDIFQDNQNYIRQIRMLQEENKELNLRCNELSQEKCVITKLYECKVEEKEREYIKVLTDFENILKQERKKNIELNRSNAELKQEKTYLLDVIAPFNDIDINMDMIWENAHIIYSPQGHAFLPFKFKKEQEKLNDYFTLADRLKKKDEKNAYLGLKYERYVASLYHNRGYNVTFYGALKKRYDNGVDLIAENSNEIILIQCKYYANSTAFNADVLLKLKGAIDLYKAQKKVYHTVRGCCHLLKDNISNQCKSYAKLLQIKLIFPCKDKQIFPIIKYHVALERYFLPCDPDYDSVQLNSNILLFSSMSEFYSYLRERDPLFYRASFQSSLRRF